MKKLFYIPLLLALTGCHSLQTNQTEDSGMDTSNFIKHSNADSSDSSIKKSSEEEDTADSSKEDSSDSSNAEEDSSGLLVVPDPLSMEVVVNKERKLPDGYVPPDLTVPAVPHLSEEGNPKRQMREEAARALEALFAEASEQGVPLIAVSGYRSYERQVKVFANSVHANGQEYAERFVALPGTSEHQTGLAMDVADGADPYPTLLEQSYGETESGKWLAENAAHFGFVLRYPEGKEDITGYSYEAWHIRYVGMALAETLSENDWTLEESLVHLDE